MESHTDLHIDDVIDQRYRLSEFLGSGASGSVYLAEHLILKNRVVVKFLHGNASQDEHQRFAREAEIMARVEDPRVARLIDYGRTEAGRVFLVREYIEGSTLDHLIKQSGSLDLTVAIRIAIAIGNALVTLHDRGIVHRDIKPSNIIVPNNPDDSKLVDFGFVGRLQKETNTTVSGELFGTPLYMAPEQFQAEEQSPAVDIYSLAATLYHAIFGTVPFGSASLPTLMRRKMLGELDFPSNKIVPNSLSSLIRRCLSPKPSDRPQSAGEFITELQQFLHTYDDVRVETRQAKAASAGTRHQVRTPGHSMAPIIALIVAVLSTLVWLKWRESYPVIGVLLGIIYAVCGTILSNSLRRWIKSRRTEVEIESGNLLLSTRSRISLGASLALQVDNLITRVRGMDDRILATSLAIMVTEFQDAREDQTRQAAIMNVVQLLEKLTTRLSPWYVRYEKLLAVMVSAVGILSGVTAVATSIIKIAKGK